MIYVEHSFRYAAEIIEQNPRYKQRYLEFVSVLAGITDDDLIQDYVERRNNRSTGFKSLSTSINHLIKERITRVNGWVAESPIFSKPGYRSSAWRLDFASEEFAVEVAFNHGSVIAFNLLKPVLASELNHVEKEIQTELGLYVCATEALKAAGNFDGAVGTFEKTLRYLDPMRNQLTVPIMIIGLDAPDSFYVDHQTHNIIKSDGVVI